MSVIVSPHRKSSWVLLSKLPCFKLYANYIFFCTCVKYVINIQYSLIYRKNECLTDIQYVFHPSPLNNTNYVTGDSGARDTP